MNILIDEFPVQVEVSGKRYKIATDFRTCLKIILAFEDGELTMYEKQTILLRLLYPVIPFDTKLAIEQGIKFLNGDIDPGKNTDERPVRLYSFAKDANYIFAAFRQTHNIDLETTDLHWWKFMALFMDLGNETTFCSLVSLRKRVKSGEATKEERQLARELDDTFEISDEENLTLEEREAEALFMRSLKV